jgi:UDP-N-acetylmuramate--alanine ligase
MSLAPFKIGRIHFIGIGGIGMSGIAEVMHNLGYHVQGSDAVDGANVQRLRDLGIQIEIGQCEENIGTAEVVVASTAIRRDNLELVAAKARHIPVVRRAEMLAELMRLKWSIAIGGTHGKTTTTSMVAAILDHAAFDPTVINGGIINAYGTNARKGEGDWMVVEADESDGSFLRLPATAAVVTNIDPEHLDHYGSFEKIREAFQSFIERIPFYGFAIVCMDHPEVQAMMGRIEDRRLISYGLSPQADVRAENLVLKPDGATFDVRLVNRVTSAEKTIENVHLPMPGRYNVQNALAAIAVANEVGVDGATIHAALQKFEGVRRRFTKTGEWNGVSIIDDYGHHPTEIASVLAAARQGDPSNVIAVVQPHRFSRLRDLFEEFCTCFNDADIVIVTPVYAAGETPITGFDQAALVDGLLSHGHKNVVRLEGEGETFLASAVRKVAKPGDMVVCLGAGTITHWANALPKALAAGAT